MKATLKRLVIAILTWEAKFLLSRTKPKIIGITGSVGKTSTKDAIYMALKDQFHTRKSTKSFNSEIGVPLTILGLDTGWDSPILWLKNIIDGFFVAMHPGEYPKVLVLEMGIDKPGDMAALTSWITPDIAVLTRLPDVPVHVEYFDSPEAVITEKLKLVEALHPDGVLVYNQDDERICRAVESVRQKAVGYSRYSVSQYTATADRVAYEAGLPVGTEFTLSHLDIEASMVVYGAIGVQHTYNFAAAAAVAGQFDIDVPTVMTALRNFTPPPGRMRLLRGLKDSFIIDDTYNSSPVAAERALQTLNELHGFQRKIVVLGDMLELGQYSTREHEKLGEQVAPIADVLIAVGVRARKIAETALEHGLSEKVVFQYDSVTRAGEELQQLLQPGDVVLLKASQSIRMEKMVQTIMLEPLKAEELLVRQDVGWQEKPV